MKPRQGRHARSAKRLAKIRSTAALLASVACRSVFLLLAPACDAATTTTIYRCLDKNLALLYTDEPCREGATMDIRAGDADPAAVVRLERERDALNESATQCVNDERRNAAQRDLAALSARPTDTSVGDDTTTDAYGGGMFYAYPALVSRRPPRPHPRKPAMTLRVALEPHRIDTVR